MPINNDEHDVVSDKTASTPTTTTPHPLPPRSVRSTVDDQGIAVWSHPSWTDENDVVVDDGGREYQSSSTTTIHTGNMTITTTAAATNRGHAVVIDTVQPTPFRMDELGTLLPSPLLPIPPPTTATTQSPEGGSGRRRRSSGRNDATIAEDVAIMRNIASFLTISDVTSLVPPLSYGSDNNLNDDDRGGDGAAAVTAHQPPSSLASPTDSWAMGYDWGESRRWWNDDGDNDDDDLDTPETPALVALSPLFASAEAAADAAAVASRRRRRRGGGGNMNQHRGTKDGMVVVVHDGQVQPIDYYSEEDDDYDTDDADDNDDDEQSRIRKEDRRRKKWAQEKLTAAVFAHPGSLRSYCWEAYTAAKAIRAQQEKQIQALLQQQQQYKTDPETQVEPLGGSVINAARHGDVGGRRAHRQHRHKRRLKLLHDLIDLLWHNVPLSVLIDVVEATGELSWEMLVSSFRLSHKVITGTIRTLTRLVRAVWNAISNFNPFQLLEAIISLQFNAMGKTSEVLAGGIQSVATGVGSASSLALHRFSGANSAAQRRGSSNSLGGERKVRTKINKKLLRKLSSVNDAARVLDYEEYEDTGGLSQQAIHRTRRMMHYTVSLRPFVAKVAVAPHETNKPDRSPETSVENESASDMESSGGDTSPFMCTPQSFPPTPHSRHMVMVQKSRFSDDDVFAARDRLRIHDALSSSNERTRAMARALKDNRVLAVFDEKDLPKDIQLTCGRHVATKIGNMNYSNVRGMIPLLRNCYVYFEITVLPSLGGLPPLSMPTLCIGLSSEEMPFNTLVGAWQGSVGLCSTGQILLAGQWCSPPDPSMSCYCTGATIGCLSCLDDDSAFETWDGVMITASVTFSVNGCIVPPAKSPPLSKPQAAAEITKTSTTSRGLAPSSSSSVFLVVPAADDVFPTVTLQSTATSVLCRFSAEDILATDRTVIGAPEQVPIYAVDGTLLGL